MGVEWREVKSTFNPDLEYQTGDAEGSGGPIAAGLGRDHCPRSLCGISRAHHFGTAIGQVTQLRHRVPVFQLWSRIRHQHIQVRPGVDSGRVISGCAVAGRARSAHRMLQSASHHSPSLPTAQPILAPERTPAVFASPMRSHRCDARAVRQYRAESRLKPTTASSAAIRSCNRKPRPRYRSESAGILPR